ncbi:hypothetical protein [Siminovitchia terrae]|uniref:hypothetical protein n=1 Tax=Siminovitchia terrae TaxID=1914933 RepID=UPI00163BEFDB|nr:hypothetical protein [Siminovitchia terrae]GIN92886.1 hypothetical protein J22TS1_39370 [Siminovitchia terrae]
MEASGVPVIEALKAQLDDFIHPVFPVSMYDSYIQLSEKVNNFPEDAIITNDAAILLVA